jgi:hypothetical protein
VSTLRSEIDGLTGSDTLRRPGRYNEPFNHQTPVRSQTSADDDDAETSTPAPQGANVVPVVTPATTAEEEEEQQQQQQQQLEQQQQQLQKEAADAAFALTASPELAPRRFSLMEMIDRFSSDHYSPSLKIGRLPVEALRDEVRRTLSSA